MGLWYRIQVNGVLMRIGRSIAANGRLWDVAPDGRPHFDHWVQDHATDSELVSAAAVLWAELSAIPPRYRQRHWAQDLTGIIQGSILLVKDELQRRGISKPPESED